MGWRKQDYELHLKKLGDDQLRDEWVELRWRYNTARVELASRKLTIRERRSSQLPRLVAAQRMREAVTKLKEEQRKGQLFICEPLPPTVDEEHLPHVMRANGDWKR